jgi:FixJ family two-component response regulator
MTFVPRAESNLGSPHTATVVLVGYVEPDRNFLHQLLDCKECPLAPDYRWAIQSKNGVKAALAATRRGSVPVVLCDRDLVPEGWKHLLAQFGSLAKPPCLIVTSRLADERLWAEALNLGAYDVLARPFDSAEVIRSVSLARLHWQNRPVGGAMTACAVA